MVRMDRCAEPERGIHIRLELLRRVYPCNKWDYRFSEQTGGIRHHVEHKRRCLSVVRPRHADDQQRAATMIQTNLTKRNSRALKRARRMLTGGSLL